MRLNRTTKSLTTHVRLPLKKENTSGKVVVNEGARKLLVYRCQPDDAKKTSPSGLCGQGNGQLLSMAFIDVYVCDKMRGSLGSYLCVTSEIMFFFFKANTYTTKTIGCNYHAGYCLPSNVSEIFPCSCKCVMRCKLKALSLQRLPLFTILVIFFFALLNKIFIVCIRFNSFIYI